MWDVRKARGPLMSMDHTHGGGGHSTEPVVTTHVPLWHPSQSPTAPRNSIPLHPSLRVPGTKSPSLAKRTPSLTPLIPSENPYKRSLRIPQIPGVPPSLSIPALPTLPAVCTRPQSLALPSSLPTSLHPSLKIPG